MASEGRSIINRTKSIDDIYEQRDRIIRMAQGDRSRIDRASEIARRYVNNISQTREYAFDSQRPRERARQALSAARERGYTTAQQANADRGLTQMYGRYANDFFNERLERAYVPGQFGRQYSRSTYMRRRRNR